MIADNWRSSHAFPLNHFAQNLLRPKAVRVDPSAIVVQRQKRRQSIELKLRDNPDMKLSQMQDLGGCRAIVADVPRVYSIRGAFVASRTEHELTKSFDYIETPKQSGYRGIHLIYKYISNSERGAAYRGLRIEVQLRSVLQHAWATAVEVAGTFRGEALKSGHGSRKWLQFFRLMGSEIAMTEGCPTVEGAPSNRDELIPELRKCALELDAVGLLLGWTTSVKAIREGAVTQAHYYVIELDSEKRRVNLTGFDKSDLAGAEGFRASSESVGRVTEGLDVVLVSADEIDQVPKAYPNYYLDTTAFVAELRRAIS